MTRPLTRSRRPQPHYKTAPVAPHAHPLVRQFFAIVARDKTAITDVGERAGISHVTISKWKSLHSPTLVTFEAALNVVGYRLKIVPIKETT